MRATRRVDACSVITAAAAVGVVVYGGASAGSTPEYPVNPSGNTFGTLPSDGTELPVADVPDVVKVVGDHGEQGFARAKDLLGVGEAAPDSPEQALQSESDDGHTIPVFASDGETQIDTFTVVGGSD